MINNQRREPGRIPNSRKKGPGRRHAQGRGIRKYSGHPMARDAYSRARIADANFLEASQPGDKVAIAAIKRRIGLGHPR